jgi:signal transduction histidine kinase
MLSLGVLSAIGLASDIGRPYGGFYTYDQIYTGSWVMGALTPRWWPTVAQAGLTYADRFLQLNGLPYAVNHGEMYATAYARGESSFELTIARDHRVFEQRLPLTLFSLADFLDIKVPPIVVSLAFWLLAVVIYRARPTDKLNRVFAVSSGLIAGYQWFVVPTLFSGIGLIDHVIQVAWDLTIPFLGITFFHCATLFPIPVRVNVRPMLIGWYTLSALIATGFVLSKLLLWSQGVSPFVAQLDAIGFRGSTVSIGLGVALMIVRQVVAFARERSSSRMRRQLTIVLIGLAFTTLIAVSAIYGALSGVTDYFSPGLDLRYLYLALPLAIGYTVVRYQTFRSQPSPLFVAVVILISGAMLASLGDWLARLLEPQLPHSMFTPIFLVALMVGALWSSQGLFQRALRRVFHWEESSYASVRQFGHAVVTRTDFTQLPQTIVEALVSELKVEQAAIWLTYNDVRDQFVLAAYTDRSSLRLPDQLSLPMALLNPMRVEPAGLSSLAACGIEALAPLVGAEQTIGVLGLGKRADEEIFRDRDLEIVELIAQQAALFLLTARQIDELKQVPRRVSEAQERERFKIAQELHDTIQQFLGRLPFFLEVSRGLAYDDPVKADELLQRSIDDVEQAAKTVRQIRANLAPFQLQTSFVQPVQDLIDRLTTRYHLNTLYTLAPDLDQQLSLEARHALYRVVQQALDNAAAHAHAKQITVSLLRLNDRITFEIADDGLGSAEADRIHAALHGSFGLKSMRDRIEALGGAFEFVSSLSHGTVVRGWLPKQGET